jgi:hypothetical protein
MIARPSRRANIGCRHARQDVTRRERCIVIATLKKSSISRSQSDPLRASLDFFFSQTTSDCFWINLSISRKGHPM